MVLIGHNVIDYIRNILELTSDNECPVWLAWCVVYIKRKKKQITKCNRI